MRNMAPIAAIFIGALLIAAVAAMGIFQGHGARCTKAGFTGAEHEACVMRVSKGLPAYEENMSKEYR